MVAPVGSVGSTPYYPQMEPKAAETRPVERSLSEARRLLIENGGASAKTMRVMAMVALAEQNAGQGKVSEAERLAREAVKLAKNEDNASNPADPTAEEEPQNAANPKTNTTPLPGEEEETGERETTNYSDVSDDSGVSFQFAQPLTPAQAPLAVMQHELSHVRRETSDAILNGQRIMASVAIHSYIDPQTGDRHVSGGRTRVVVFPDISLEFPAKNQLDVIA